ncbi:MAG: hypothetical protein GY943_30550 [Chloroflexi bacterium]|nr:hypothetical protein [Chloroflexota bacterium]
MQIYLHMRQEAVEELIQAQAHVPHDITKWQERIKAIDEIPTLMNEMILRASTLEIQE